MPKRNYIRCALFGKQGTRERVHEQVVIKKIFTHQGGFAAASPQQNPLLNAPIFVPEARKSGQTG